MSKLKLSILIPVWNEGVNIEIMLKILSAAISFPHEILVIYDSPDDSTVPVVLNLQGKYTNIKLVYNNLGRGIINAIKSGISVSEGEYVLIFAADEVGPVMAIEDMVWLLDNGCDLVSATRYAHGGRRLGGSIIGSILSRCANRIFCLISKYSFTDATTGIKMFRKEILDRINLEARPVGWAVVFELAIKAQLKGMRLGEVPIVSIDRLYGGKSTFRLGPWIKEYLRWFIWGALNLKKYRVNNKSIAVRIPQAMIQ